MNQKDIDRFWSKVEKTDGCWYWTAGKNRLGYGFFQLNGKKQWAHRIAYELAHNTQIGTLFACHSCDTPSCVCPDHIFLGTATDNNADRHAKNRSKGPNNPNRGGYKLPPGSNAGENHPRARLTWNDVANIRARFKKRIVTAATLASEYGVSQGHIWNIIENRCWHIGTTKSYEDAASKLDALVTDQLRAA